MHDLTFYKKLNHIIMLRNKFKSNDFSSPTSTKFLEVFNYCLMSLKNEYKTILINSYFESDYQFWWVDYYCKSSYYRKRYWAVVGFVRLFEMIYENFNDYSNYFNFSCK